MAILQTLSRKADTVQRHLLRMAHQRWKPQSKTVPVFVVGCQRSGTSMTLRVFEHSLDTVVYRPRDQRAYHGPLLRPSSDIRKLLSNSRAAVAVFKPMCELQWVRRFLDNYPGLRIVWLLRDYRDSINSMACKPILTSRRNMMSWIVREELGRVGWRGEGLTDRQLDFVRRHYSDDMSEESAHALFWYLRNSFYFELSLQHCDEVRVFRYEDLVTKPAEMFEDVFDFCGCPFQAKFTREIFSTSVGKRPAPTIDAQIEQQCRQLTSDFESVLAKQASPSLTNSDPRLPS